MSILFDENNFTGFATTANAIASTGGNPDEWQNQGTYNQRTINLTNVYYSDPATGYNPFSVSNGVLSITASATPSPDGQQAYSSGLIMSQGLLNFEYGYVAVTAQLPAGAGLWPAIWMLPSGGGWPPELDIMEMLGQNPNIIYTTTHNLINGQENVVGHQSSVNNTSTSFNTYAVDWEPNTITWYFDGKEIFQEATPATFNQPMYLVLNLGVGKADGWGGAPNASTKFPATMQVSDIQVDTSANTTNVTGGAFPGGVYSPSSVSSVVGTGVDGYIKNATVSEAGAGSTTTGANGTFTLTSGTGPITLTGGTDTSTGLAFNGVLTAPQGSTVVTPLTALIESYITAEAGKGVTVPTLAATEAIVNILGLPAGTDLTTFDPVAAALAGSPAGIAAYADGVQLQNILSLIRAAGGSAPNALAYLAATAIQDVNGGLALTLTDPATVAAAAENAGLNSTAAANIASIVHSTALALETQLGVAATPLEAVNDITGAGIAEQGDAVTLISQRSVATDPNLSTVTSTYTQNLNSILRADDQKAANNYANDTQCFLRGTRIATPQGEVEISALAVGDKVLTVRGDVRPIVWVGSGRILVPAYRRNYAAPVIIRRGALCDAVPHRDLHVTGGHSLFLYGVLVPAEFLVNHRSIVWDDNPQEIEVFHIELDCHDAVIANGAPAESYRDDGNRWLFQSENGAWSEPVKASFAPVLTGGAKVDRIWRRLLERSGQRLYPPVHQSPDLHLVVDGERIEAAWSEAGHYVFTLCARAKEVIVRSRSGAPDELARFRDPRRLGVAVSRLKLFTGGPPLVLEAADLDAAEGFHAWEPGLGAIWTNGAGRAPMALIQALDTRAGLLHVEVAHVAHYPYDAERRRSASAA